MRGAEYTGLVRDADNGHPDPLPGATVEFYNGANKSGAVATNGQGRFEFNSFAPIDCIVISHVGYKTNAFPVWGNQQQLFELEKADTWLDPVIVTAHKKKPWLLYGLILFIIIKGMNK